MKTTSNKVLVIAAHPDDEILGCGGSMLRHLEQGDYVHCLIMAEGLTSREEKREMFSETIYIEKLAECTHKVAAAMGLHSIQLAGLPDNRMDSIDLLDVIKIIEKAISTIKPNIVYTHFEGDLNIDHQIVSKAVITACRPQVHFGVDTLLFFEIPSSTEWNFSATTIPFRPNWYCDISHLIEKKIELLNFYDQEMRKKPHPRSTESIRALHAWRGSTIVVESAEAFVLGRHTWKY